MSILKILEDIAYCVKNDVDEALYYLKDIKEEWKRDEKFDTACYSCMQDSLKKAMDRVNTIEEVIHQLNIVASEIEDKVTNEKQG